jgi:hypothetical protein
MSSQDNLTWPFQQSLETFLAENHNRVTAFHVASS